MARKIIKTILIFISLIIIFFTIYFKLNFNHVTFEQLLFSAVELEGVSLSGVIEGIIFVVLCTMISFILMILIKKYLRKKNLNFLFAVKVKDKSWEINTLKLTNKESWFFTILFLIASCVFFLYSIGFIDYIKAQLTSSTFIEENYVDGKNVEIAFPEEKQNLIYIFVESLEMTNAAVANSGGVEVSFIPNLENLALANTNFSNTDHLGGFFSVYGTSWTVAAMMAQSSGTPLKVSIDGNSYYGYEQSLPGVYSIGEVLEENGYHNYLMLGSDASYGGRRDYFTYHGNYTIYDYNYAKENGLIDDDYYVWWGYEDRKLYEFAKERLTEIAKEDTPFNFTMLTADTHFTDGYLDESCPTPFSSHYANSYHCTDMMLSEFIRWIQEQDFYENTTIVIVGDHYTMQSDFYSDLIDSNYTRVVYNTFINSLVETTNSKNRLFSTFDLYPTTLASIGASIEGNRLGLGTNLFSDELTLLEKYDISYVNTELAKKSFYYDNVILGSTYYKMQ